MNNSFKALYTSLILVENHKPLRKNPFFVNCSGFKEGKWPDYINGKNVTTQKLIIKHLLIL